VSSFCDSRDCNCASNASLFAFLSPHHLVWRKKKTKARKKTIPFKTFANLFRFQFLCPFFPLLLNHFLGFFFLFLFVFSSGGIRTRGSTNGKQISARLETYISDRSSLSVHFFFFRVSTVSFESSGLDIYL
jgi:hypothetical protein